MTHESNYVVSKISLFNLEEQSLPLDLFLAEIWNGRGCKWRENYLPACDNSDVGFLPSVSICSNLSIASRKKKVELLEDL